jgi:hypothetical protein
MDLYLGYELNDHFNVWLGRMLPPASRASSAAPLYSTTFDFPIAEQAPNLFSGRDNGATLWGTFAEQKLKYMLGGFQGHQSNIASQADNPFVATRLQYNFWDTEPGFYNMASYDGSKSILSIGGSVRYQKDGAATAVKQGDYFYWNMDGRLEKPLANGAGVGAEASYYNYNNDHTLDGSAPAGSGYFILASYMFPKKIGIGYIQPRADYQAFSNASNEINTHRYELGAGYLLDGSNIRVDLFYFNESRNQNLPDNNGIKLIFHLVHFF